MLLGVAEDVTHTEAIYLCKDTVQQDTAEKYKTATEYFGLPVKSLNCSGPVSEDSGLKQEAAPQQRLRVFLNKIAVCN